MNRLIENIKGEVISNMWANKVGAQFEYDIENNHYRLIELSQDLQSYIVEPTKRNGSNCPIVVKGFIAFLIRNWDKKEVDIYKDYYTLCYDNYQRIESKKPGSFLRNLDDEFYTLHISIEMELIKFSKKIYLYLSNEETELINKFTNLYFKYIENEFSPRGYRKQIEPENQIAEIKINQTDEEFLDELDRKARKEFKEKDGKIDNKMGNDFIISTIEDYLSEFKSDMPSNCYESLVFAFEICLKRGKFPKLENEIRVGRVNKKSFGWSLSRIFKDFNRGIELELLNFAKQNISIFKDVEFDIENYTKSNLYKYFTTKPNK